MCNIIAWQKKAKSAQPDDAKWKENLGTLKGGLQKLKKINLDFWTQQIFSSFRWVEKSWPRFFFV